MYHRTPSVHDWRCSPCLMFDDCVPVTPTALLDTHRTIHTQLLEPSVPVNAIMHEDHGVNGMQARVTSLPFSPTLRTTRNSLLAIHYALHSIVYCLLSTPHSLPFTHLSLRSAVYALISTLYSSSTLYSLLPTPLSTPHSLLTLYSLRSAVYILSLLCTPYSVPLLSTRPALCCLHSDLYSVLSTLSASLL
jgi:hypothetical protein